MGYLTEETAIICLNLSLAYSPKHSVCLCGISGGHYSTLLAAVFVRLRNVFLRRCSYCPCVPCMRCICFTFHYTSLPLLSNQCLFQLVSLVDLLQNDYNLNSNQLAI